MNKVKKDTKTLAKLGILSAVSVALVYLIHFPIVPAVAFMEYDPADVPILLGTFAMGPLAGLLLTAVISVIQGFTVSSSSGIYGIIMHILATGTLATVSGVIYKKDKTKKGAIVGLVLGSLAMAAVMVPANLIVTPIFTGWSRSAVEGILLTGILPFNLIKAGLNSLLTFLLYKRVSNLLHR